MVVSGGNVNGAEYTKQDGSDHEVRKEHCLQTFWVRGHQQWWGTSMVCQEQVTVFEYLESRRCFG